MDDNNIAGISNVRKQQLNDNATAEEDGQDDTIIAIPGDVARERPANMEFLPYFLPTTAPATSREEASSTAQDGAVSRTYYLQSPALSVGRAEWETVDGRKIKVANNGTF